ncbi:MAG: hypothetical protein LBB74_05055 [Chitinispirillales bacterium]|nr:hypothetical protein [Chitinispirillales bacterium]
MDKFQRYGRDLLMTAALAMVATEVSVVIVAGNMLNKALYDWSDNRQKKKALAESAAQDTSCAYCEDHCDSEDIANEAKNPADIAAVPLETLTPEEILLGADIQTVRQKYKNMNEMADFGDSLDKIIEKKFFELTAPKRGWEKATYCFFRDKLYRIDIDYIDFVDFTDLDSIINKLCASRIVDRSLLYGKTFNYTWNYKAESYITLSGYGLGSMVRVKYFDFGVENRIDSVKSQMKSPEQVFSSPKYSLKTGYDNAAWGTSVEHIKQLYSTSEESVLSEVSDKDSSNGFKTFSQKLKAEECGFDGEEFIPTRTFEFYRGKLYKVYINEEDCYESYSANYDPNVYPIVSAMEH